MIRKFINKWNANDGDRFHFRVSIAKSALRIVAGLGLVFGMIAGAGLLLIAAEVLGVVEEM